MAEQAQSRDLPTRLLCYQPQGWGGLAWGEEVGLRAQSPPRSSPPGPSLSEGGWAGEPQREEVRG